MIQPRPAAALKTAGFRERLAHAVARFTRRRWAAALVVCTLAAPVLAADPPGFNPARHMHVSEVQPGMKGYGLTVFHGTKIEPFPVEVVSIQEGFSPGKAVVWIRCPGDRMQLTGPVQGMSGSPIFLWPNPDPKKPDTRVKHTLGKGGRIIGAFALGHRLGKDCYAGVRPIEAMLWAASRAKTPSDNAGVAAASKAAPRQQLLAAEAMAHDFGLTPQQTWRLDAICKLMHVEPAARTASDDADAAEPLTTPQHLMLPMSVASVGMAKMMKPFFEPLGLEPVSTAGPSAPPPPSWVKGDVKIEPGGVFAVPLAMGPLDMSAIGTATDVLPDGTVLAFGHQMFAQGPIAVPMATGFIHYVQPNLSSSFKIGGTLKVVGTMVRDEATAVVGKPVVDFPMADEWVHVRWPDAGENHDYHYQVVHHEQLLPALVGSVAAQSMTSDTTPPKLSTLVLDSTMKFDSGRTLHVSQVLPGGGAQQIVLGLVAPLSPVIDNAFASAKLVSVDTTIQIENGLRTADLVGATVEQSVVKPGDDVVVHVRLQPYGAPPQLRRVTVKVPDDAKDGQYVLQISGARAYHEAQLQMKPYLGEVHSADELYDALTQILALRDDAMYTMLKLPPANNLAIGREPLPHLPSSRVALLASDSSTRTTPYADSVDRIDPMPFEVNGQLQLQVTVDHDPNK